MIFLRHTVYFPGTTSGSLMRTRDHLQRLARQTNDLAIRSGYRNFKREVKHDVKREVKFLIPRYLLIIIFLLQCRLACRNYLK